MLRPRLADDGMPSSLFVLPIPPGQVLLPSSVMSIQIERRENIQLLQTVLTEAERARTNAILAIAPIALRAVIAGASSSSTPDDGDVDHDKASADSKSDAEKQSDKSEDSGESGDDSVQVIKLPAGLTSSIPDDSYLPSVRDISECESTRSHIVNNAECQTSCRGLRCVAD